MAWGRIDDSFYDHPKLDLLGKHRLPGAGMFVLMISWSNRYGTDGFIPTERVLKLGGTRIVADAMVEAGLLVRRTDGYQVHDFLDYNDSALAIKADREAARERMRAMRSRTRAGNPPDRERSADIPANTGRTPDRTRPEVAVDVPQPRPGPSVPDPTSPTDGGDETFDDALWGKVMRLAEELTGITSVLGSPYGGFGAMALAQATAVPWPTLEVAYRKVAAVYGRPTARQLMFDAEQLLRPAGLATGRSTPDDPDLTEGLRQLAVLREERDADPQS